MKTFQTIWKFSRHSRNFPDHLVTCQKIWKLSRRSILSRLYGKFPEKTKTFQTVQKHSSQSGNFPDDPETFQKLKWFPRQIPDIIDNSMLSSKTFRTRKKFSGSNAPPLPTYFCLCLQAGLYLAPAGCPGCCEHERDPGVGDCRPQSHSQVGETVTESHSHTVT